MAKPTMTARSSREAQVAEGSTTLPLSAIAIQLLELRRCGRDCVLFVARNERRAASLARMLGGLSPSTRVLHFPAWDCVPYDRAPPSREAMGRRIKVLRRLSARDSSPWILLTTPEALSQRIPPSSVWSEHQVRLATGDPVQLDALESFLVRTGYLLDDRVDEAGEAALRGAAIDVFPAGAEGPYRLDHSEGRVTGIRRYDPASQRTNDEASELVVLPASEVVLPERGEGEEQIEHHTGIEHRLPEHYPALATLFDYASEADLILDDGAEDGRDQFWEQVQDGFETRRSVPGSNGGRAPLPPQTLYIPPEEWTERLGAFRRAELRRGGVEGAPSLARERDPGRALGDFITEQLGAGRRIVLAAATPDDLRSLKRRLRRAAELEAQDAPDWDGAVEAPPGAVVTVLADIETGFVDAALNTAIIAARDLLGSRAGRSESESGVAVELGRSEVELRPGDAVIHFDHGMAVLKGIEVVSAPGAPAEDAVVLEFADQAKLLVRTEELGRIWRYGAEADAITLDKLGGATWPKRRAALEADLAELASKLALMAAEREAARAEPIVPSRGPFERFAAGFAFTETPDQARAIEEVLDDLASGRPMDRLVCGDVGFGKTEVALRAAAAAALAGRQVAVVAPTTVLVRQHVNTFRRRFAGLGIEVGHLSRLVKAAEARAVKQSLASGDTRIVIGTHALAGSGVTFKDLGLLIIDEEQRFGSAQKAKLRALGESAHVLTLTATPIPRTLQGALVGLQDLSIIATPPVRRQPVRTFLTPFDPVTVRSALLRERRRGGQSFVVCPRVEDIDPMSARLNELVPELHLVIAHGKMPADEMDAVMVEFADGVGDVLLATNIIESGLDVPRANTMLIWRADRFGLSQLHQLRGRVGRGRARGTAYLLTDPDATIAPPTEKRLRTLEAMDRLGAGFAISSRDLDIRGAGDLVGDEQAGHVKLIGVGLYQHLLQRALAAIRGEVVDDDWTPGIRLGLEASIPADYVPEPEIRISLFARLAHMTEADDPEAFADEIADRFGPLPDPVHNLIAVAHLRRRAYRHRIERLDAGPEALAVTFRAGVDLTAMKRSTPPESELTWRGDRLVWPKATETAEARRKLAGKIVDAIAGWEGRRKLRQPGPEPVLAE